VPRPRSGARITWIQVFIGCGVRCGPAFYRSRGGGAESLGYMRCYDGIVARAKKDKLLLFTAALLAERRKARGLQLNYPESVALISAADSRRRARDGRSVAELMSYGATVLKRNESHGRRGGN